jgi:hypothetical protein
MAVILLLHAIETDQVRVVVAPERGARITSLIDRRTGRDWLAQGEAPLLEEADACYGLAEAAGWDECFPTVSPCTMSESPWAGCLRDHGELWGRCWRVDNADKRRLVTTYGSKSFRFTRDLSLRGATLEVIYRVENMTTEPAPFLWAMHPLFALRQGERIDLPSTSALVPTYLSTTSRADALTPIPWPEGDDRIPFRIDCVQGADAHFAGKFFAAGDVRRARIGGAAGWLDMTWRGIARVGIWITYGGWPSANDIIHVGIEPTTSPDDQLSEAIKRHRALKLLPRGSTTWSVALLLQPE